MFLFCLVFAMSLCASVYMCFVVTCWERADLLALVCGVYCEFVTFPLVSWVRRGTWLYRFLIFAPFLTLKPTQPDQCLNLHFSFTMQLLHQLTFQTIYKFSPCPYNRLTIHFITLICKRHRSHTLSQTFTLATFNFSPHPINQHLTPVFCA